jgi:hypothetical protein
MCPKINVMERECKKLKFGGEHKAHHDSLASTVLASIISRPSIPWLTPKGRPASKKQKRKQHKEEEKKNNLKAVEAVRNLAF